MRFHKLDAQARVIDSRIPYPLRRDKIYLRAQHSPDYAIFRTINQPRCKCCGKGAS